MVVELIAKDKEEKYQYEGRCKLTIDSVSKLLLVEPFNEEFKMISAVFKWKFVAQKNILFVFAEHAFQDFCLILDDTAKCDKTYKFLLEKGAAAGNQVLIKERFLLPLLAEIQNAESALQIKQIIFEWIENQDEAEKQEYFQILKDSNSYNLIYSTKKNSIRSNPIFENDKNNLPQGYQKSSCNANDLKESNDKIKSQGFFSKKRKLHVETKIIEAPNFELLKYIHKNVLKMKLFIFSSPDKKFCYEYFPNNSNTYFYCSGCTKSKSCTKAKIVKRNGNIVVKLNGNQHVCEIKEYNHIIEKPNFEKLSYEYQKHVVAKLILFSDSSHIYCYEYSWENQSKVYCCRDCNRKKHYMRTDICQKEDGTEFVMLKSSRHVCEPRKFNREKYGEKEIIRAPNLEICDYIKDGVKKFKLNIFTSADKTFCYEYYLTNGANIYGCNGCQNKKKYVTAEIIPSPDGNNYVKLSKKKHACEPREYDPEKFDASKKEIVGNLNFGLFHFKRNGASTSRLIVFCSTNKNLCYEYHWNKLTQIYQCSYCPRESQVTATICHQEDSKDYVILNKNQHICELTEFNFEKYKDDMKIDKDMYEITSKTLGQVKNDILIIFTCLEKKLYYKFIYNIFKKYYYCSICRPARVHLTATFQNEGKEDECVYVSNQKHVCKPFEYSTITNGNIIQAPNFQLLKRKKCGKIVQKMVVFTNKEKTLCYEYTWSEYNDSFKCQKCMNQKLHVYAKIFKNTENEECVELSENVHKCIPIKFVPEYVTPKIVKLPNFKLFETVWGKRHVKKLSILDSKQKNYGYIYTYHEHGNSYRCHPCLHKKKNLTAKVFQDESGQRCVELNESEHACTLQKV